MTPEDQESCEFEIHAFDRWAVLLEAILCIAFVLMLIGFALYAPPSNPRQWPWLIGLIVTFSGGSVFSLIRFQRHRSRYRATGHGIAWLKPGESAVEISWSAVEEIREHATRQFLEVRGTEGRVIHVEHSVVAYDQLREIIDLEIEAHWHGAA